MALSEYEQRKLNEIERSLHSDDPAVATSWTTGVVRHQRRVIAAVIFVGGVVAPIGGAVTAVSLPAVGIVLSVLAHPTGRAVPGSSVTLSNSCPCKQLTLFAGAGA